MNAHKLKLAEMLWEYSRYSLRLRQAVMAARAWVQRLEAAPNDARAVAQVGPMPVCGPFGIQLVSLADRYVCPSWPEKAAQDCPDELRKVAHGRSLPCILRMVPNKTDAGVNRAGQKMVRLHWSKTEILSATDADAMPLPLDVFAIDWRLSDAAIAEQIAAFRPERFKNCAVGKKGKPIVDEKRLPATLENALDALDTLRKFKECGKDWPTYFDKYPHPEDQERHYARNAAWRKCKTARKVLKWLEAVSIRRVAQGKA